jgi:hypothetical protein
MKKVSFLLAIAAVAASLSCGAPVPADLLEETLAEIPDATEPVNLWPPDYDLGVVISSGVVRRPVRVEMRGMRGGW